MANAPIMDEDFLNFESKVNQVVKLLEDISSANKTDADEGSKKDKGKAPVDDIDEETFIVRVRDDRTLLNKKASKDDEGDPANMEKFTFMQQVEKDANERAEARKERERIAQNFRKLGNEAYRKDNFEKAINMYTKAIEHVKDSPILYNNRALSYIKMKNYKRSITDCEYVLNKLEEKNLRSWLYRAIAYKRLGDDLNYENSLKFAHKNNPKQVEYIENFMERVRTTLF